MRASRRPSAPGGSGGLAATSSLGSPHMRATRCEYAAELVGLYDWPRSSAAAAGADDSGMRPLHPKGRGRRPAEARGRDRVPPSRHPPTPANAPARTHYRQPATSG